MELAAGDAPMMELGKMLGQTGVNLVEVKRRYDEASAAQRGEIVPAVITVYEDPASTCGSRPRPPRS